MIRSNGQFVAVMVPEGASDFNLFYERYLNDGNWKVSYRMNKGHNEFERAGRNAKSTWIPTSEKPKIIGLLSSYNPIHRLVLLEDWDEMCDVPKEEYSQWLIIKKG